MEKCKARAKVEHIFFHVKRMFGYDEVRYRGMAKSPCWWLALPTCR